MTRDIPRFESAEDLARYIGERCLTATSLGVSDEGYNESVEAMIAATLAAFRYTASLVGASGFQASVAALTFLGEVNGYRGPYAIIDAGNMIYPQYDIEDSVRELLAEWKPWAAEEAAKLIADASRPDATLHPHPDVLAHWHRLVAEAATSSPDV